MSAVLNTSGFRLGAPGALGDLGGVSPRVSFFSFFTRLAAVGESLAAGGRFSAAGSCVAVALLALGIVMLTLSGTEEPVDGEVDVGAPSDLDPRIEALLAG